LFLFSKKEALLTTPMTHPLHADPLHADFAAAMAELGPWGPAPSLGVAVSGGADSMALALLTQHWARRHSASVLALIVDHGLRASAACEAETTRRRLVQIGIDARVLTLSGLPSGARLQETARRARYAALLQAARSAGALFLLLGHHQADQSETVAMRAARGSGGLQGMAACTARNDAVLLRPLLNLPPEKLRDLLRDANIAWIEDPSNTDKRFERVRMRLAGTVAAPEDPTERQRLEQQAAEFLARRAIIRPEGFAVVAADEMPVLALASLLRTIAGADYAPRLDAVSALAAQLRPATLGGVRVLKAGRLGAGWLLAREPSACAPPLPAVPGAIWDGRFRLAETLTETSTETSIQAGAPASFGAVGADAAKFRHGSDLPAVVLRGLPCIRQCGASANIRLAAAIFSPPGPAAPHPFIAAALPVSRP
jgi:tRNA(Ile)-lysidine synthase